MTDSTVYTLPFPLQLCYKPLGILQSVTKSEKVHISTHDVLKNENFITSKYQVMIYYKNFITWTLLDIGHVIFSKRR